MKLIEPTIELKTQYLEMLEDWNSANEDLVPFPLSYDPSDFQKFVEKTNSYKTDGDEGFVHHSTFWLITEDNIIVGVSNLRHYLTDRLLKHGGHIGFGIRPSYRRNGYATKILELSLIEASKLGIEKVLVTCDKNNIASSKTILKNGGVFWREVLINGELTLNYWIDNREACNL